MHLLHTGLYVVLLGGTGKIGNLWETGNGQLKEIFVTVLNKFDENCDRILKAIYQKDCISLKKL